MKYVGKGVCTSIYPTRGTDEAGAEVMATLRIPRTRFPTPPQLHVSSSSKKTIARFPLMRLPTRYRYNK